MNVVFRIWITSLAALIGLSAFAQNPPQKVNANYQFKSVGGDSGGVRIPKYSVLPTSPTRAYVDSGAIAYRKSDSSVWYWTGTEWLPIAGSGAAPSWQQTLNVGRNGDTAHIQAPNYEPASGDTAYFQGDSKTAPPGYYTTDSFHMWARMTAGMLVKPFVDYAVSGRSLIRDSATIFSQMPNTSPYSVYCVNIGINDLITDTVTRLRFISCYALLIQKVKTHLSGVQICTEGIDAYNGLVNADSLVAWNNSIDSMSIALGVQFFNIYTITSVTGGATYTLDNLHGQNDWNYIEAVNTSNLLLQPLLARSQTLVVNGQAALQNVFLGATGTYNHLTFRPTFPLGYNDSGSLVRFGPNDVAMLNPPMPQVGGWKTALPDTAFEVDINGTANWYVNGGGHLTVRVVSDNAYMYAYDPNTDIGVPLWIQLAGSYTIFGTGGAPANPTNVGIFDGNQSIVGAGLVATGENTYNGAPGIQIFYVPGNWGKIDAYDFSTTPGTPLNLTMQDIGGQLSVGDTVTHPSAKFVVTSTSQGVMFPRMSTTQKLAIASPEAGVQVYDLTLNQMSYYNGTTWINF